MERPSMSGIPYWMDFLDLWNEAHLRPPPSPLAKNTYVCFTDLHDLDYIYFYYCTRYKLVPVYTVQYKIGTVPGTQKYLWYVILNGYTGTHGYTLSHFCVLYSTSRLVV